MPLTKSMQVISTIADPSAYAEKDLGSGHDEIFIRAYCYIPAATLTAWEALFDIPDLLYVEGSGGGGTIDQIFAYFDGSWHWYTEHTNEPSGAGALVADTWYKLDWRLTDSSQECEFWLDDVSLWGPFTISSTILNLGLVRVGNTNAVGQDDNPLYITGVSVGTTRGAADLFDGDLT